MGFLDALAEHVLKQPYELKYQCIVLPSRRSVMLFKQAISKRVDKPIILPHTLTMADLAVRVSGLQRIDPLKAVLELYEAYTDSFPMGERDSFERFQGYATAILHDFNMVDTYLIPVQSLYQDLAYLKSLNEWAMQSEWSFSEGAELSEGQQDFNQFWQSLGPLYDAFHDRLHAQNVGYGGMLLKAMTERQEWPKEFRGIQMFLIAGFNVLAPAEVEFMDGLHQEGRLQVAWDYPEAIVNNPDDPASHFMRKWLRKPWNKATLITDPSAMTTTEVGIHASPNVVSSVRWVGEEVSRILDEEGRADGIAIILADEGMLGPLLDALPKDLDGVNVTMGIPLKGHSVFQLVEAFMHMQLDALRYWRLSGEFRLSAKSLVDLIHALQAMGAGEGLVEARRRLGSDGISHLSLASIEELPWPEDFPPFIQSDNGHGLLDSLLNVLTFSNPESMEDSAMVDRVKTLVQGLKRSLKEYDFVQEPEIVWSFLRSTLSREQIPFIGEPLAGLQVLGLMESRALDYKHIFMLGANEDKLPRARNYKTFLPYDLRMAYGLPGLLEEEAGFAYYFYRLLGRSSSVQLIHERSDEMGGGEQSRYLTQLISGIPSSFGLDVDVSVSRIPMKNTPLTPSLDAVEANAEVREALLEYFSKRISFSGLSKFFRCPMDFLYGTVFQLQDEEIPEGMENNDLGDLVHSVLESTYREFIGTRASLLDIEGLTWISKQLPDRMREAIEADYSERVRYGIGALTKDVAIEMLERFIQGERSWIDRNGAVMVEKVEVMEYLTIPMDWNGSLLDLRFKAKIDRIDRRGDRIWLIDYKTGRVDEGKLKLKGMDDEKLFHPDFSKGLQLLYYAWFYWRRNGVIPIPAIIALGGADTTPLVLEYQDGPLDDEALEEFERKLLEQIGGILSAEVFAHDMEQGKYCMLCPDRRKDSW